MNKKSGAFLLLACAVLMLAGCGVSREELMERGIYAQPYSSELLSKRIEETAIAGDSYFRLVYYGSIRDIDSLQDNAWNRGYVVSRYVKQVDVEYREYDGYVEADYTIYTMDGDILAAMPRNGDELAVFPVQMDGVDRCLMDMMEHRAEKARYLVKADLPAEELTNKLNGLLHDYQAHSYAYPYMISGLSWTVTSYGEVTELELEPEYRAGAKNIGELPRVSTIKDYIDAVSDIWNSNCGSDADVILEGLPLTEDEIFDALMIAEANAALVPCEADEVSYVLYLGDGERYILSAALCLPLDAEDMAPMRDMLSSRIEDIANSIMVEQQDDEGRYSAAYRAVLRAAEYDDGVANATEDNAVTEYMHILRSAYGALVEGDTVCVGYTKAYKALCDEMGLECISVNGWQDDVGHMWNMVMLDGTPYYVDCTYGDTGGGGDYCLFPADWLEELGYRVNSEYGIYGLA